MKKLFAAIPNNDFETIKLLLEKDGSLIDSVFTVRLKSLTDSLCYRLH